MIRDDKVAPALYVGFNLRIVNTQPVAINNSTYFNHPVSLSRHASEYGVRIKSEINQEIISFFDYRQAESSQFLYYYKFNGQLSCYSLGAIC